MKQQIGHPLTQTNVDKAIAQYQGYGREVDEYRARLVGKNMVASGMIYPTATIAVGIYKNTIWNMGLVN